MARKDPITKLKQSIQRQDRCASLHLTVPQPHQLQLPWVPTAQQSSSRKHSQESDLFTAKESWELKKLFSLGAERALAVTSQPASVFNSGIFNLCMKWIFPFLRHPFGLAFRDDKYWLALPFCVGSVCNGSKQYQKKEIRQPRTHGPSRQAAGVFKIPWNFCLWEGSRTCFSLMFEKNYKTPKHCQYTLTEICYFFNLR